MVKFLKKFKAERPLRNYPSPSKKYREFLKKQQKKFFEKISNFLMLKKFIRPHLRSIEG